MLLIIDDDKNILNICKTILEMNDYNVKIFENFHSALSFYRKNKEKITAILLDMYQPDTNYIVTIPALLAVNPEAKIIGMSGSPIPEDLIKENNNSIKYFLKKPFVLKDLIDIIAKIITPNI